ncbi:phosphatase PAP2 family protein [Horticoccus luteus]|uniref:Phosphatase PAP2 family protein n=1 Tax=Horticoccus luteus TaxID=2862869 RepID=A0A8F9TW84_9BACT|nr:phosphatase PAP2 family protein [Horticoccus luteus]QYM79453.1 phosphatase PAP2 family protein [Horticoccus luteus]
MTVFFTGYFAVLNHPVRPVTLMPVLAIDRWVGVQSWTLIPYVSLWIYVPAVPALLRDRGALISFGWAAAALATAGLSVFMLSPTAVPQLAVDWSRHPGFGGLKALDATGNACPSLHVAFAVFAALAADRMLRAGGGRRFWRIFNALWALAIVYSTMATKQHVSLDVVAGCGFGVAAMALWEVLLRRGALRRSTP